MKNQKSSANNFQAQVRNKKSRGIDVTSKPDPSYEEKVASSKDSLKQPKVKLGKAEWIYALKRTLTEFLRKGGMDMAATLTYFVVLAFAPTLLAIFSLSALLLNDFQDQIVEMIMRAISNTGLLSAGPEMETAVRDTLDSIMGSTAGGTVALIIGIASAMWSASAFVKAFSRTSNQIYKVEETRGLIQFNGSMYLLTVGLIIMLMLVMVSLLLNETIISGLLGPIFVVTGGEEILNFFTSHFLPIWAFLKWPVILIGLFATISLLYWGTPNLKKRYRFISPGGVLAIIGLLLASLALSFYMSNFAAYSSYGAIGAVLAVLFALWVINIVVILGAIFDSEVDRAQQLAAGKAAEEGFRLENRGEKSPTKNDLKYEELIAEGRDLRIKNLHSSRNEQIRTFAGND